MKAMFTIGADELPLPGAIVKHEATPVTDGRLNLPWAILRAPLKFQTTTPAEGLKTTGNYHHNSFSLAAKKLRNIFGWFLLFVSSLFLHGFDFLFPIYCDSSAEALLNST